MSAVLDTQELIGQHVRIWPYARGLYPRDTLYRLWRVVEECGAGPKLFWGNQDPAEIHSDLTAFVKFFDKPNHRCLLIVTNLDASEIAGCIWFDDFVPHYRCFGSIFIRQKYAGNGTMEASRMALTYAFDVLDVQQIWGTSIWPSALRLCLRLGFQIVAELPEFTVVRGRPKTATIMRITRGIHGE